MRFSAWLHCRAWHRLPSQSAAKAFQNRSRCSAFAGTAAGPGRPDRPDSITGRDVIDHALAATLLAASASVGWTQPAVSAVDLPLPCRTPSPHRADVR